jgi:hypothetical protein
MKQVITSLEQEDRRSGGEKRRSFWRAGRPEGLRYVHDTSELWVA